MEVQEEASTKSRAMHPLKKELHVAIHAQTARFRVGKYIAFVIIFGAVYTKLGGEALLWALGIAFVFAIAMHLFYRWMTNGWEDSWGGYESLFK
jgi:hypothetical protein